MKVLLIDVNCKHSSTGKIVYDLYTELNNSGHEAAICYGRGPLIKEKNIFKFGIDLETYFHAGMTRLTGLTGFFSFFSTFRLINYINKYNPDVVHIHELHSYFVNYGTVIKYLKKKNIRTIWTFHCEFMYTGKCGYAYECEKWKKECNNCPQVKEYPKSLIFDFSKEMYRYKKKLFHDFDNLIIVTPSEWLANRVRKSFLFNKDVKVINNGIDTSIFYPRNIESIKNKLKIKDETIIVSVAPNIMDKRKGGKWVVELAKRFLNKNVMFILIGVNNLSMKFGDNVIAIKRTSNQKELAEYYSLADSTLITSSKETFSLVCAESLACGTMVIGFESGAPSEIAPEGFGTFVNYSDLDGLEELINSIIEHKQIKKTNILKMRNFAFTNYDNYIMTSSYLKLYSSKTSR